MLYFAYGSNMSLSRMEKRKTGYESFGKATLIDYSLSFNKKASAYSAAALNDSIYPKLYDAEKGIDNKVLWKTNDAGISNGIEKRPEFRAPTEGYANVVPDNGEHVEGVLYVVPETGIVALDICEGFPTHYSREILPVQLANGATVDAIVYVATRAYQESNLLPSDDYLAHLIAGKPFLSPEYFKLIATQKTIIKPAPASSYNDYYSNRGRWDHASNRYVYEQHGDIY